MGHLPAISRNLTRCCSGKWSAWPPEPRAKLANIAGQFLLHLKPGVVAGYCNLLQPASALLFEDHTASLIFAIR
jgi:hypothetical protein